MAIKFYNEDCNYLTRCKRKIASVAVECVAAEGYALGDVSVIICSDAALLEVNRKFLGHDYFTDVITFDYTDNKARVVGGDIFISIDTVAENAKTFGASKANELHRVIIHGLMHLCGYKDKTERQFKIMKQKEDQYLTLFNA